MATLATFSQWNCFPHAEAGQENRYTKADIVGLKKFLVSGCKAKKGTGDNATKLFFSTIVTATFIDPASKKAIEKYILDQKYPATFVKLAIVKSFFEHLTSAGLAAAYYEETKDIKGGWANKIPKLLELWKKNVLSKKKM